MFFKSIINLTTAKPSSIWQVSIFRISLDVLIPKYLEIFILVSDKFKNLLIDNNITDTSIFLETDKDFLLAIKGFGEKTLEKITEKIKDEIKSIS